MRTRKSNTKLAFYKMGQNKTKLQEIKVSSEIQFSNFKFRHSEVDLKDNIWKH